MSQSAAELKLDAPLEEVASAEFAAAYQAHSREIYYLTLRLLGDPEQAQDATHDIFLRAYRKWDTFRGDASRRTWLYRIAINHCTNLRQSWHQRHIVTSGDETLCDNAAAPTDSPLRVLETKELGERIQKTLDRLPEEYCLLLLLLANEELSYEQMGILTGQSPDAVRGKLHRARKAFAAIFPQTA